MSELTLLVLRLAFLAVLWLFVFAVVYALRTDLFGQRTRRMPQEQAAAASPFPTAQAAPEPVVPAARPAPAAAAPPRNSSAPGAPSDARRLVITSGAKEGMELELSTDQLTIGRSGESGLVIRDDYTSTHHARLMHWDTGWVIQDLDSTNGTYLDGQRVVLPTPVPLNTPVKIGTTTFELRR